MLRSEIQPLVLLWVPEQVRQLGPGWVLRLRVQELRQWECLFRVLCLWALSWWEQ